MKVVLGADRYGYDLKEAVKENLQKQSKYEIIDKSPDKPSYYADAARAVAGAVRTGEAERGIVMCGTGMGVSIIANKHKGVYAALCESVWTARRSKTVNNTNVLCIGGFVVGSVMAIEMVNEWLKAEHLQDLDPRDQNAVEGEFHSIEEFENEEYMSKEENV